MAPLRGAFAPGRRRGCANAYAALLEMCMNRHKWRALSPSAGFWLSNCN